MRKFEKVSFDEFKKSTSLDRKEYDSYVIPKRSTKHSAGYDFYLLNDVTINPGEVKLIPTGVKAFMEDDEVLFLVIRSSLGFKYNIRLCNQVGVIDSDYYNNPDNEGHIFVKIQNEGDSVRTFLKGERIVQGIFSKFLTVDEESEIENERQSGIGSTTRNKK